MPVTYTTRRTVPIPPINARTRTVTTMGSTIGAILSKLIGGTGTGGIKNNVGVPSSWRPVTFSNSAAFSVIA